MPAELSEITPAQDLVTNESIESEEKETQGASRADMKIDEDPSELPKEPENAVLSQASNEAMVKAKLLKRYYEDAIQFVQQIQGAIPSMCELLSSTTKAEVIEAMDFFVHLHHYNMESAEVSIEFCYHVVKSICFHFLFK